ncbi:MAG: hypothetical protein E7588_04135 [Ruminococcaceae bacterium]|nr:hypothetical protein [Oscillospiraceae bacterium]
MEKTNVEIHGYSKEPIYEMHTHMLYNRPVTDTVDAFKNIMRHFNFGKMHLASIAMIDTTENVKALYCKDRIDNLYASGSINHHFDSRDTSDFFLSEIKKYHAMGCDSIKILESKPSQHLRLYTPDLSHKVYEKFFNYAEENQIPLIMHVGDPLEMWDLSKMSQYAIERGWYCGGEGRPSLEDLRKETENILKKFPKLRLSLAHFFFMSDDIDRVAKMLDSYENLYFDLCIENAQFANLTDRYNDAKKFFIKYSDRFMYGTDTYHFALDGMTEEQRYGHRINQIRSFVEMDKEYIYTVEGTNRRVRTLALDKQYQDNIFRNNFIEFFGQNPRKIDREMVVAECEKIIAERELDELMRANVETVKAHFSK